MIDVVAVPHRLENGVGKPQHENVLHGLLAQIVIDAVDLGLAKYGVHRVVQPASRLQVRAKGFFNHDPPRTIRFIGQSALSQPRYGVFIKLGRRGQVVDPRDVGRSLDLVQAFVQCIEVGRRAEIAGLIVQAPANFCQAAASNCLGWNRRVDSANDSRQVSSVNTVRENPTIRVPSGSRPLRKSWYKAGTSLRLVKSPEAPKITKVTGTWIAPR